MGATLHDMVRQGRSFSGRERNCCFLNLGGPRFADVSSNSGFDFPDDGRSIALCDWNFDGRLDLWIANRSGPQVRFLLNQLSTPNHFLALRLEGQTCNRDAIGAQVSVTLDDADQTQLTKTLRAGEGFLSQSSKWLHFGLGAAVQPVQVVVRWPGGETEDFGTLAVDRRYAIKQNSNRAEDWTPPDRKFVPQASPVDQAPTTDRARVASAARLPLPPLDYETFSGERHKVAALRDSGVLLLNLWASWCRPCLGELKALAERDDELKAVGLDVLALSVDRLDTEKDIPLATSQQLLNNVGYTGPAGWATAATAEKLQMVLDHLFDRHISMSVPTSLLITAEGELAVVYRGPLHVDQLLEDVERLPQLVSSVEGLPFPGRWLRQRNRLSPFDLAWKMVERDYLPDSIEYLARHRALFEGHYQIPKLLVLMGNGLLARGEARGAVSFYRQALKIDVNYGEAMNNLAWVLATHPDDEIRDGDESLRLAKKAVQAQSQNAASLLDTLAAAYAELGEFDRAQAIADQAVKAAKATGQLQRAQRIESRLHLYESNKPYRDQ